MPKLLTILLLVVGAAVGGYLLSNESGKVGLDFDLFDSDKSTTEIQGPGGQSSELTDATSPGTVRIASFNIQSFGQKKAGKSHVMDALANVVRQFDIVAIQEIRSKDQTLIPNFVSLINSLNPGPAGSQYEYVLGPRLGRTTSKEQYAFIFNSKTIEVDRSATYTIADPHDRLHREPLTALFRTRAANSSDAFTFKLVNIHVDPDDVSEEMNAMDDVYRAVFNNVDREDDIIVLGDFNTHEKRLYEFGAVSGIVPALVGVMTNTLGTESYDNLYFHEQHTREFNGKAGLVDLVRVFNLNTKQAEEISDHLPVWAEFSIFEGGGPGRLAARPGDGAVPR